MVFTQVSIEIMLNLRLMLLSAEIDKIAANTRFNDVALLDGSYDQTIRSGNIMMKPRELNLTVFLPQITV